MRYIRLRQIHNRARINVERFVYRCRLWASTLHARRELSKQRPLTVLLDNSVLAAGRIFSTKWFNIDKKTWGYDEFGTGLLEPYPTHAPDTHGRLYQHVLYLPGIVHLAQKGYIEFLTSHEMDQERFDQPAGRYLGRGYLDHNVFGRLSPRCVDKPPANFDLWERSRDRLRRCSDQPFLSIARLFGEKNNVDAWHLHTLLTHDIDLMLHIDHPLADFVKQHQSKPPISQLMGRVIMPMELAHRLRIEPIDITAIPHDWL